MNDQQQQQQQQQHGSWILKKRSPGTIGSLVQVHQSYQDPSTMESSSLLSPVAKPGGGQGVAPPLSIGSKADIPASLLEEGLASYHDSLKSPASEEISRPIYPVEQPSRWKRLRYLQNYLKTRSWKFWLMVAITMLIPIIILVPLALTGAIPVGKHTEKLQGPIVDVGYSTFQGNTLNGIYEWLGVRYAQPPTKELRFKAPQEPKDTKDPQQANKVSLVLGICAVT
jgi:hypothetical protein